MIQLKHHCLFWFLMDLAYMQHYLTDIFTLLAVLLWAVLSVATAYFCLAGFTDNTWLRGFWASFGGLLGYLQLPLF